MKKIINIIIAILLVGLSCGLGYFYFELQERDDIIDNLEEEIDSLVSKTTSLKKDIDEKNIIIKTYEDILGEKSNEVKIEINTSEYSNIKKINFDEVLKKSANKESFILIATMTSCSHCIEYKPIINEVLSKNNLFAYEIDLQEINSSDRKEFTNMYEVDGTPTTLFFINGKENTTNRLIGSKEEKDIKEALINNGFIK